MAPLRPTTVALAGGLGSGALLVASLPPAGTALAGLYAVAPAYAVTAGRGCGLARGFLAGLVAGTTVGLFGASWLSETVERFAGLPSWGAFAVHLLFALYVGLPFGLAGAGFALLRPARPWVRVFAAAALHAAVQALFPAAFGYHAAVGLAGRPALVQGAELGGVAAVCLLQGLVSALAGETFAAGPSRRAASWLAGAVLLPAAAYGAGAVRMAQVEASEAAAPKIRVGLVQPQIPLDHRDRGTQMAVLRRATDEAAARGARLVVWPESVYPWSVTLPFPREPAPDDPVRAPVVGRANVAVLFATTTYRPGSPHPQNGAFLVERNGRVSGRYAKVELLPFGERVPLVDPAWAEAHLPGVRHYEAGDGPRRFELSVPGEGTVSFAPLICYEDGLPAYVRRAAALDPEFFVNLTNDSWFGASSEPYQHRALAVFRAVEHRRPMVRAVNEGPSGLISGSGRPVAGLPLAALSRGPRPQVAVVDVPRVDGAPTVYARGGHLLAWLLGACAAWILAAIRRSPSARRTAPG